MSGVIRTEGLGYIYSKGLPGEKAALRDVSIEIEEGEFIGIIGHTGSGKSTLIQQFNGLLRPTSGRVFVDGEDVWEDKSKLRSFRFKVGLVFQYPEYQLFEETVRRDVGFGPMNMGLSETEIEERVAEAVRFVGLDESVLDASPFDLSGGQKRRVAIAGVIAMDPKVLIFDEPAAGLDPRGRAEILGAIKALHRERGGTVIIVSHSMEDIAKYADRVLVINEGTVFDFDTVERVFRRSAELRGMGLSIPAVTGIMLELRQRGFPVDDSVFTVSDAVKSLLPLLKKGDY